MKQIITLAMFLTMFGLARAETTTHVTLTYYQPVRSQCDSSPTVTADGSKIKMTHLQSGRLKWCAISRDLLYLFKKGKPKRVWIEGFGVYEVRDLMNKRFHHRVDILIHPKDSKRICKEHVKVKIL